MKYISLIDELGLDIEALSNIDASKIIRLQKQLKANAVLNNTSNLGELSLLIEHFKDEKTKQNHLFVEKHVWLKKIISGQYTDISEDSIIIDNEAIKNPEALRHFLTPYFKENIKPFLSAALNNGKYQLLLLVVRRNFLFSEEINQIIVNFFKSKLNYASVYLRKGKTLEKGHPIAYINDYDFIRSLNEFPNSFSEEIEELCSAAVDLYNSKRRNTDNINFIFAAKTMVALGKLDVSNTFLKDLLDSNAEIAEPYSYNTRRKNTSGSGYSIGTVLVVIFIIIRIIVYSNKSSDNTIINIKDNEYYKELLDKPYGSNGKTLKEIIEESKIKHNNTFDNDEVIEETVIESTVLDDTNSKNNISKYKVFPKYSEKFKLENHIRFLYTLKRKTKRKTSSEHITPSVIKPLSNPYPKTFYTLPSYYKSNDKGYTQIKNKSMQDLIVFRLLKGIDESLYIPKNKNAYIDLKVGDSLVFYTGKNFVDTQFSHFIDNTDISKMYTVEHLEKDIPKEISILPFYNKINIRKNNIGGKTITTIDTLRKEAINTKSVKLNTLNIDRLYTNYYNKKYKN